MRLHVCHRTLNQTSGGLTVEALGKQIAQRLRRGSLEEPKVLIFVVGVSTPRPSI